MRIINTKTRLLNAVVIFFFCLFHSPFAIQAQVKHPAPAKGKIPPPVQPEAATPNPFAETDKKALSIPDSLTGSTAAIAAYITGRFATDSEKIRAAFVWVATNIRYDVPNMYAINYYEKTEDKIAKALQTRQGICENYAAVFADICRRTGIRCYVVEGYVRIGGQVSNLSHAWCTALMDTTWYLYDPTWAAGSVMNGVYVQKLNNFYYQSDPLKFLRAHMPFDPMWQLLYHPLSFAEFNEGTTKPTGGTPFFLFPDSIALYEKQTEIRRDQAAFDRIDKNGPKNAQVFNQLQFLRQKIEIEKTNDYNDAVADYNRAIASYNEFIRYRNKQFSPMRPDAEIQAMLDSASIPFSLSKQKLSHIDNPGPNITNSLSALEKQMSGFAAQLQEQEEWLAKYFTKGRAGRRGMFNKVTLFGRPLN